MPTRFTRTTRSLASDGGAGALLAWMMAGLLLAAWLAWFVFGRITVYEVSRRARLEVQQSAHSVAAPVTSRIAANALVLGQEVRVGEVLVELDAGPEKLRLAEEEARLQAIGPRIVSLQREIAVLEQARGQEQAAARAAADGALFRGREAATAVAFASDNEQRLRQESAVGGVAQIEVARAQAETLKLSAGRDALGADLRRLDTEAKARNYHEQAQIESLRRAVLSLEGEARAAQALVARLREDIDRHAVRSPVAGTVADVAALRSGAYVAQGQQLATVVPHGRLIVVASFAPAAVLGRIRAGQTARLRLDGFPWAQYGSIEATVTRVAGEVRDGLVRVEFQPVAAVATRVALQHGLPGSIEVDLETLSPARLVLRAAGRLDGGGAVQLTAAREPAGV